MSSASSHDLRIALYARVSTDEQREGQTILSQLDELRRFADQKHWIVVDTYKDDGWSGAILERPELDRLRDDAAKAQFDAVLVNDVDRLARDVSHLGVIKRALELQGIQLIFRKLPVENSPTNNLLINILGSFAEFERELIADRTRRGRRHKVEACQQFLGCLAPYGFRYLPKHMTSAGAGELVMVPEAAALIRKIYRWVDIERLSAHQVVHRLNHLNIPPPRNGSSWQKSSILRILRNEIYAGIWYYNKHAKSRGASSAPDGRPRVSMRLRSRQEWIALVLPESLRIIDRARWERVQRCLDQNRAFSRRNTKHNYLLRGLLRCGACSSAYVGEPGHGRYYYRCASRCRKLPSIKEDRLNEIVWNTVTTLLLNPDTATAEFTRLLSRESSSRPDLAEEREQLALSHSHIASEEERLLEAYRLGVLTPTALGRELEKLQIRRSSMEAACADLPVKHVPVASQIVTSAADFLRLAARRLQGLRPEDRQVLLRLIIQSIVFEGGQIRIHGRIPRAADRPGFLTASRDRDFREGQPTLNDVPPSQPTAPLRAPLAFLSCRIATTAGNPYGRNPADLSGIAGTAPVLHGHNPPASILFELVAPVLSPTSTVTPRLAA